MRRVLISAGALNGLAATAVGAAAEHLWAGDPGRLELALTGARYGLPHAAALLALAAMSPSAAGRARRLLIVAEASLALGATLFAFSLYLVALGAPAGIEVATPVGGTLMLLGWASLVVYGLSRARQ